MNQQEPPKLEYPCSFPLKIIGDTADDFESLVVSILAKHAGPIDMSKVKTRASRNNSFLSVSAVIMATSPEQLEAINAELKATGRVKMVI